MQGQTPPGGRPMPPPFSPVLLLGLALKPFRPAMLQPVFNSLMRVLKRRHPDILERLEPYAQSRICIDPIDLPFLLVLGPDPADPRLTVRREIDREEVTAVIRGPLDALVKLAEGKVDGDALFFSRQLTVEGDTEVIVALRNAVDGAGIDLIEDITAQFGPFSRPLRSAAEAASGLASRLQTEAESFRQSIIAPAIQTNAAQSQRIAELESEVRALRKSVRSQAKHGRTQTA